MNTSDVVERVVDAQGGLIRWRAVQQLHIDLSSEGLVFATKGQPCALHDVQATVTVAQQQVQLTGTTPRPWSGTFASPDALADAVARLRTGSRRWYWRMDDIAAFAATALWAYLALPLLLAEPDVRTEVRPPSHAHSDWDRIDLDFPHRIATHCRRQTIHVDQDGRIRRHDYTATAFGQWAHAAQLLDGYRSFDGLLVATHRRVHPRLPAGHIAAWPTASAAVVCCALDKMAASRLTLSSVDGLSPSLSPKPCRRCARKAPQPAARAV